ncbi:MAG: glycosyltransferase family protein [Phycisphaerae bacterium]
MEQKPTRRIIYGVHGYGRGHAARALAVLPHLTERYDVRILAGDDAFDQLRDRYDVTRIPVLRYYNNDKKRRSAYLTLKRNTPGLQDMLMRGPIFQMVCSIMNEYQPDVVISDSEGWTHHVAHVLKIPRISFDHYGVMAFCRFRMSLLDRITCWLESRVYRMLIGKPERIIAAAFYDGAPKRDGVTVVGPILRERVRQTEPAGGDYLLTYFSNASENYTPEIEQALQQLDVPVKMYGLGKDRQDGNIQYRPFGNEPFLRDLAGCRAVFATAGNQLISEAIHFGKPMLLVPEESLEQRLNAKTVQRWHIGVQTSHKKFNYSVLEDFWSRVDELGEGIDDHRRDGLGETLEAMESAIDDLTASSEPDRESPAAAR